MQQFTAKRELLLLTVFRKGNRWGMRVEEIDDGPEGAWAPDITYPDEAAAKAHAILAVEEIFGYGYTKQIFNGNWRKVTIN